MFSRDAIVGMAKLHRCNRVSDTDGPESRRKATTEAVLILPLDSGSLERFSHLPAAKAVEIESFSRIMCKGRSR